MGTPGVDYPLAEGALHGMRVLDLTQVLSGPYCTMLLGDLGADVIKVEQPDVGDPHRRTFGDPNPGHDSPGFWAVNRNKRSVCLDLKSAEGVQTFLALAGDADVIVESWRPGVAARLGVDYETVRSVNPRIVYASISGFGQYGPYSQRPGYDLIAQAMTGIMSVSGDPATGPGKSAIPLGDLSAGLFAALGILAAYSSCQRTGQGQHVETSLFEACLALSVWESVDYFASGVAPRPVGIAHRASAPYQPLRTRNGHVVVAANNDTMWRALCRACGLPDLPQDPAFATNALRVANREQLAEVLESATRTADTEHWVEALLAAGVPVAPIRDYAYVLDEDPHVKARGMVEIVDHPVEGPVRVIAAPLKMSATPPQIRLAPPTLGEHTHAVLAEIQVRS